MIRFGLTGSIAMGKSTTAQLFREEGVPMHDADEAVHRLYAKGGAAVGPVRVLAPEAVEDGAVSREQLKRLIGLDPTLLERLEAIVHPLVLEDRIEFERRSKNEGADIVGFDIPLLYETGAEGSFDAVVVVTAPPDVQRRRALERPGMTEAHLDHILSRQTPDAEKRARADFIVDTSQGLDAARRQVRQIVAQLRERAGRRDA